MYSASETWADPLQALRDSPVPSVNLLASEPYSTNSNETLPLRSTTYNAKYVNAPPFSKGSMYIQGDCETGQVPPSLELDKLTLSQLYTLGYTTYMQRQRLRDRLSFHLPPAPPDFDSNAPTDPQLVAQYVRGLATAYNSIHADPTPFHMYQHLINRSTECYMATLSARNECSCTSLPDDSATPTHTEPDSHEEFSALDSADAFLAHFHHPQVEAESFSISLALASIGSHTYKGIQVLLRTVRAKLQIVKAITAHIVTHALEQLDTCLRDPQRPLEEKVALCSLMGIIVTTRGVVQEVLLYVRGLEVFASLSDSHATLLLPHAQEVLDNFSFNTASLCPIISPIDYYQEDSQSIDIMLWEGANVTCFCCSADGQLLAVATTRAIKLFSLPAGTVTGTWNMPEGGTAFWHICFSSNASHLIGTDATGHNHALFTANLRQCVYRFTLDVSVAIDVLPKTSDELLFLLPPQLPHGHANALHIVRMSEALVRLPDLNCEASEQLTICSHVHRDYRGTILQLSTAAWVLSIQVDKHTVTLSQNATQCFGVLPTPAGAWLLLHVRWCRGTWYLTVNSSIVELRGARSGQSRSISVQSAACFGGIGRVGSLAVWTGSTDPLAVRTFFAERRVQLALGCIVSIPLDEGMGMWIKETVSGSCHTLDETVFTWDRDICTPCSSSGYTPPAVATGSAALSAPVRLDPAVMLGGKVLVSAYKIYLVYPQADKNSDGVVAAIDRASNTITKVYRCPKNCTLSIYALLHDESELLSFQPRFSTFSRARLHTARHRENRLASEGFLASEHPSNTVRWVIAGIYRRVFAHCMELQRIPIENTPLHMSTLQLLASMLRDEAHMTDDALKALATVSLLLVHLRKLRAVDEVRVSRIASTLKEACEAIQRRFIQNTLRQASSELLEIVATVSLTLDDLARVFISDDHVSAEYINKYVLNDTSSVTEVVNHIVVHYPTQLPHADAKLLSECLVEASAASAADRPITRLMPRFVLASVCALKTHGRLEEITALVDIFIDHAFKCVEGNNPITRFQTSSLHTAFLPLLITVADHCPDVLTDTAKTRLLSLLSLLGGGEHDIQLVPFAVLEAYDAYPPASNEAPTWRFIRDFSRAAHVAVLKEVSTSSITIVCQNGTSSSPKKFVIDGETPFAKMDGGTVTFFGDSECVFTVTAEYVFSVDVSWRSLLTDAVKHLLLRYAEVLTLTQRSSDVFLSALMRNGLTSTALRRHGVDLPGRDRSSEFAVNVLENKGDGKLFVDQVCASMRGSIVPSMRPAIQALLAILVHSGASTHQAEDELKLRWFGGEWGSKLQGPSREATTTYLRELATWMTGSLQHQSDSAVPISTTLPYGRRASQDRRVNSSVGNNASRSVSGRRGSTSSRRSLMKVTPFSDVLEQVRGLLSRGVSPDDLEHVLVERTRVAMKTSNGLDVLAKVASLDSVAESEMALLALLQVLWRFAAVESGTHFTDAVIGAGFDLEMRVRAAFHAVLEMCESFLLVTPPKDIEPHTVLTESAVRGKATMLLLAVLCHPWDIVDCGIFSANYGKTNNILTRLEHHMNIPTGTMTLTGPWRLRRRTRKDVSEAEERVLLSTYMGAADLTSLSRVFPNDFSISIPQFQTSRSEEGVAIEKNSNSTIMLRADEAWQLGWKEGVPRVFYFEVKLNSPVSRLEIGLGTTTHSGAYADMSFVYNSNGNTHLSCTLPPFVDGDTVGCGIVATSRQVFFTLNGELLAFMGVADEAVAMLWPELRFDEATQVRLLVNFGTTAFCYDFRSLHPALTLEQGPTWYRVATTASIALHYITTRTCGVQDIKKPDAKVFLSHCCEVVCQNVNKVTSSLISIGVAECHSASDSGTRVKQSVVLSVAEYSIMLLIATMRQIVCGCSSAGAQLPNAVSEIIFDAASVLMLLPLHSVQISTISLLPDVIPHIREVSDSTTSNSLVCTLFDHANEGTAQHEMIPFVPMWSECDPQCISIANVQLAHMVPETQRSIVLGAVLPRVGVVSFSVRITRRNMSKGHSLKGGYFIGVSVPGLTPLSPTSNSQSWKAVKPPIVWALHDTTPQLPHATNPTVAPNNFQRTFGSGDIIRVVVDRDKQTIDFYREDDFLKTLFSNIPTETDLVPFVQLYNDDAVANICEGYMTAPILAPTLLSAASVDVLRSMLTLEPFQHLVARGLCHELDTQKHPRVTLALFNSLPDPRVFQLRSTLGDDLFVTVTRIGDMRCKFSVGGTANYEHLYNLRSPAKAKITCSFDTLASMTSLGGLSECIARLVAAVVRLTVPLLTLKALGSLELDERNKIIDEERANWDFLFHGLRAGNFVTIQKASQSVSLIHTLKVPTDYTFSPPLSNPGFTLSPHYCGRLATVPSGTKDATTPFIAIAEPCIPSDGKFNIRCQMLRGHNGQILGGGYYFGVCTSAFNWKRKDLSTAVPEVWALHDLDDTPWRLRHLHSMALFPVAADPRCIIVSGDIIRLEINRKDGTMWAYRKPLNGEEIPFGMIYDNLPAGNLYPFVQLFNTDAVAVLLPSNSNEPALRVTVQQPHFAMSSPRDKRACDGCAAQQREFQPHLKWYKCNECVDYALCKLCFDTCVHSYHAFTEMNSGPIAHSTLPPTKLRVGMEVSIPGANCMYLRSSGCVVHEEQVNCVVEAVDDNALAIWGLVCKARGQLTMVVDTTDGEPLSLDHPTFVGVGSVDEVMKLSRDKLRDRCFSTSPSIVSFCSDPALRKKLDNESRHPYGFSRGSTITIDIDLTKRIVTISRDWIAVGSRTIEFPRNAAATQFSMCFFALLGTKNTRVSVIPERCHSVVACVDDVKGSIVTVSTPDRRVRYVSADNCRVPLHQCPVATALQFGHIGYTFVEKRMRQCKVVGLYAGNNEVDVKFQENASVEAMAIPLHHFLTADGDVIAEERLVPTESTESTATLEDGFVISRLLLILSCLCENDTLAPLVILHSRELMEMVDGLASVHLGNEAPLDFLEEIRTYVGSTANAVRGLSGDQHLSSFVPTLGIRERKRRCKTGVLVQPFNTEDRRPGLCRYISRSGESLVLESLSTGEREVSSYSLCVPIKQCAGQPWYTLPNGLPWCRLEHTVRLSDPAMASASISLEGCWSGELAISKNNTMTIELHLTESGHGTATTSTPHQELCTVYCHFRYQRRVRFCLVDRALVDPTIWEQIVRDSVKVQTSGYSDDAAYDEWVGCLTAPLSESNGGPEGVYFVEADIDSEGLRMVGMCRLRFGKKGTFCANSTRRMSLAATTTDLLYVEPLPDFVDTVIPSREQRGIAAEMHRLIVLLARHLHLVVCTLTNTVSKDLIDNIFFFATHPLTDRLVSTLVGIPRLFLMVYEAYQLIFNPSVKPWEVATLSRLISRSLLLRPETLEETPESFVWDVIHAVVVAAHRCGSYHRYEAIHSLTMFLMQQQDTKWANAPAYEQLFAHLFTYVDRNVLPSTNSSKIKKDISAGVEMVLLMKDTPLQKHIRNIPVNPLHCLMDLWRSFSEQRALPKVVESSAHQFGSTLTIEANCTFGDYANGELKVGKVMSSCATSTCGHFYYEVILPDRLASPFAVGWGTQLHSAVPTQHVGCDRASFSFNGNSITTKDFSDDYKIVGEIVSTAGCVIGCLLDMEEKTCAWSINGVVGSFISIPIAIHDASFFAFVSIGTCTGMRINLRADDFQYSPDGYTDLTGRYTRVQVDAYDCSKRSSWAPKPIAFFTQLASYLSDVEEHEEALAEAASSSGSATASPEPTAEDPRPLFQQRYSLLAGVDNDTISQHAHIVSVIESCMATANRFVDLDGDQVSGNLSVAFVYLKSSVRRAFRQKILVNIPPVDKNSTPAAITIRVSELYSTLPRSSDVALQHTVLSQMYKQIGSFSKTQWSLSPLFKVNLYISGSRHAPIDLGGPYRQLWTFLADEIMRHPDKCYPHSDFHRNPLFVFVNNSRRISLVPDTLATSTYELTLFNFLGKIMGHAARSKQPLDIDFSPFMWKYFVDDSLTVRDYYQHVDSVVEKSIADDNFLMNGMAEEIVPYFGDRISWIEEDDLSDDTKIAEKRRAIAEKCLVQSMDEQLGAIRKGLWSILPRRAVRCLSWRDLEKLVCGETNPSLEMMKRFVRAKLNPAREKYFWDIVAELSGELKASLLCFASGQRRLPLIRPITVTENTESIDHLPRAQSCSSLITIPPYPTCEVFRAKLLLALQHQMEMELA